MPNNPQSSYVDNYSQQLQIVGSALQMVEKEFFAIWEQASAKGSSKRKDPKFQMMSMSMSMPNRCCGSGFCFRDGHPPPLTGVG